MANKQDLDATIHDSSDEDNEHKPKPWGRLVPLTKEFETVELDFDLDTRLLMGRAPACDPR